jgi:hypothetical protein
VRTQTGGSVELEIEMAIHPAGAGFSGSKRAAQPPHAQGQWLGEKIANVSDLLSEGIVVGHRAMIAKVREEIGPSSVPRCFRAWCQQRRQLGDV